MKFFSENLKDLRQLYTNGLRKALDMEQQIEKALPTMIEKSHGRHFEEGVREPPGRDARACEEG